MEGGKERGRMDRGREGGWMEDGEKERGRSGQVREGVEELGCESGREGGRV